MHPAKRMLNGEAWAARLWRVVRGGAALLTWREAVGCLAVMGVVAGIVAAAHASNAAADAAVLQMSLTGAGTACSARLELLFEPIPSFMRTLSRSLQHVTEHVTPADWADLAAPLLSAMPYAAQVSLYDEVSGADRASWEANMTAEYGRPVRMLVYATSDVSMPSAPVYFPVSAVVGPSVGVLVPGRNVLDSAPRAAAIVAALRTGDVAATEEVIRPLDGRVAHAMYMPVHWPASTRTSLIGITMEDEIAFDAAVGDVAGSSMSLSICRVASNGIVVSLYTNGLLGTVPGVTPSVTTVTFLNLTLQVAVGPSAAAAEAVRTSRLTSSISWGAPIVAAAGVISVIIMALRLLAQAAATRQAMDASDAARDSVMSYFFHELRNPLHAALGLVQAMREDAPLPNSVLSGGVELPGGVRRVQHDPLLSATRATQDGASTSCGGGVNAHLHVDRLVPRHVRPETFTPMTASRILVNGVGSTDSGGSTLCEVERQLTRMASVMDGLLEMTSHGERAAIFDAVDVPALLRDVAQVCRAPSCCVAELCCSVSVRARAHAQYMRC